MLYYRNEFSRLKPALMITPFNSRTEAGLSATIIVKSLHLHLTGAPKLTHKYSSLPDLKCRNNCNIHTYTSDDDLTTAVGDKNSPRTGCLDYNLTLKGKTDVGEAWIKLLSMVQILMSHAAKQ